MDAYIRALRIMKEIKSMDGSPENIQAAEQLKRKLNEKQKEALKKDFS